ncbi:hypothetical protein KIN20_008619 [Parelaphostrongylus tenuis]|uniref:Uncharacterized protein n=1 Tax=Parelaphostrongylus tenuis TaxID=148309 RepID=A0AAD5MRC6_PARTN|nr:hypothetical protein KIN20_008619 [Parelaphostrongylus tenuis]
MCRTSADAYAQSAAFSRNSGSYADEHRRNRGRPLIQDSASITARTYRADRYYDSSAVASTSALGMQICRADSSRQNSENSPLRNVDTESDSSRHGSVGIAEKRSGVTENKKLLLLDTSIPDSPPQSESR